MSCSAMVPKLRQKKPEIACLCLLDPSGPAPSPLMDEGGTRRRFKTLDTPQRQRSSTGKLSITPGPPKVLKASPRPLAGRLIEPPTGPLAPGILGSWKIQSPGIDALLTLPPPRPHLTAQGRKTPRHGNPPIPHALSTREIVGQLHTHGGPVDLPGSPGASAVRDLVRIGCWHERRSPPGHQFAEPCLALHKSRRTEWDPPTERALGDLGGFHE